MRACSVCVCVCVVCIRFLYNTMGGSSKLSLPDYQYEHRTLLVNTANKWVVLIIPSILCYLTCVTMR